MEERSDGERPWGEDDLGWDSIREQPSEITEPDAVQTAAEWLQDEPNQPDLQAAATSMGRGKG